MCESVFKVLLIGDHSVGKTTFVASYVLNKWVPNLKTTIGGKFMITETGYHLHWHCSTIDIVVSYYCI